MGEKHKGEWAEFKAALDEAVKKKDSDSPEKNRNWIWDAVLDGANIGHHNQNWDQGAFSRQQIDDVLEDCKRRGKHPVIVIREHWLRTKRLLLADRNPKRRKKLAQLADEVPGEESAVASRSRTISLLREFSSFILFFQTK